MARKSKRKVAQEAEAAKAEIIKKAGGKAIRKAAPAVDEDALTKGQLRKLVALRKSVGEKIGASAFGRWLAEQPAETGGLPDKNAEQIAAALEPLVQSKKLRIRRGGYLVTRGRGRVIVAPAEEET